MHSPPTYPSHCTCYEKRLVPYGFIEIHFRAAADSGNRSPQSFPRDAPPRDNCIARPIVYDRTPSKRTVEPRYVPPEVLVAGDCFNVMWLILRLGKNNLKTEIVLDKRSKLAQLLKDHA